MQSYKDRVSLLPIHWTTLQVTDPIVNGKQMLILCNTGYLQHSVITEPFAYASVSITTSHLLLALSNSATTDNDSLVQRK